MNIFIELLLNAFLNVFLLSASLARPSYIEKGYENRCK